MCVCVCVCVHAHTRETNLIRINFSNYCSEETLCNHSFQNKVTKIEAVNMNVR